MIDYERMKRSYPKQKAALTRAQKKGYPAVLAACTAAVREWNAIGAWPDEWSRWQRALDDAAHVPGEWMPAAPRLEDLAA